MPALGGAAAEPLRFLDFLIRDPVRSILLHNAGVSVVVPDPARYAVHKLMVAGRRQNDAGGKAKSEKDLRQAAILFEVLPKTGGGNGLAAALEEEGNADQLGRMLLPKVSRPCRKNISAR
jgi:hypothetical protein